MDILASCRTSKARRFAWIVASLWLLAEPGAAQAAAGASCDADPTQGIPALPAATAATDCTAPAADFVAALPAMLEGVLRNCVPVAGMTAAQAEAAAKQTVRDIQFKVATQCAALPPALQPAAT